VERDLGFQAGAVTQLSQRLEQRFPVGAEAAGAVDRRQRLLLMEDATKVRLSKTCALSLFLGKFMGFPVKKSCLAKATHYWLCSPNAAN
jgi:hypothetical protein